MIQMGFAKARLRKPPPLRGNPVLRLAAPNTERKPQAYALSRAAEAFGLRLGIAKFRPQSACAHRNVCAMDAAVSDVLRRRATRALESVIGAAARRPMCRLHPADLPRKFNARDETGAVGEGRLLGCASQAG